MATGKANDPLADLAAGLVGWLYLRWQCRHLPEPRLDGSGR
jgi:hypothetical protein